MVEMAMFNVQRAITPKKATRITVQVFCTLSHSALHFFLKFHENIINGIGNMAQTGVQCSKGYNSKSRQTTITIHVLCTSFHWCITMV